MTLCIQRLSAVLLVLATAGLARAEDLSALKPFLKKQVSWPCVTIQREVPLAVYSSKDTSEGKGDLVIVYVLNHVHERIGMESDLAILSDAIQKGYIVITVDFQNDPGARSPDFDADLHRIFRAVYGHEIEPLFAGTGLKSRRHRCFFLPAGYRLVTDLVYWDRKKHGVYGTLEWTMKTYNEDMVPKYPALKPVSSPDQMVDLEGKPFDYTVKMDIVYPSQPKRKLPLIFDSATEASRQPLGDPRSFRPHMAGFTMRGYVFCEMGHCYNPNVDHFIHFPAFEADHWNGLACYTAAMRFLRMNAEKYSIDTEHFGGVGHSKGQYAITRLSDPNHVGGEESKTFAGFPRGTPEPQPWPGYSSRIHVGYQSMGMGTFEPEYITADYMPTIIACGELEREVISKRGHPIFVKRLEELDANHIELFMQGLGHDLPYGYDEKLGVDRYKLMHAFFDRYLKVDEKLPPVALLIAPRDQRTDVAADDRLFVHFAPVIDPASVLEQKGVEVVQAGDRGPVRGSWKVSHGGTRFTFVPEKPLTPGAQYEIAVTSRVRDKAGTQLQEQKSVRFTMAQQQ